MSRLAKRSQCPNCKKKYAIVHAGFVNGVDVFRCSECQWMSPLLERSIKEKVFANHEERDR